MRKLAGVTLLALMGSSCGTGLTGEIEQIDGDAHIVRGGEKIVAREGSEVKEGDSLITAKGSTVVLEFDLDDTWLEVQASSHINFQSLRLEKKQVYALRGMLWLKTSPDDPASGWQMLTRHTRSHAKGGKYYFLVSQRADAICHCEGTQTLQNRKSEESNDFTTDQLVLVQNENTIPLSVDDLLRAGIDREAYRHRHSTIEDSELGDQDDMTKDQRRQFGDLFNQVLDGPNE